MALAARQPDIIIRPSIPLAATSDQPVAEAPRPPESASAHPDDQSAGTPKEITPQEQAVGAAARQGDPATADAEAAADADAEGTEAKAADEAPLVPPNADIDSDAVADTLPGWAQRQILAERKKAREYRTAIEAAAKAKVGSAEWEAAVNLARDQVIQKEREAAASAGKKAREAEAGAEAARKELEELKARAAEPRADEPANTDPRPARDAFDDPDAYDDALTEWATREGVRATEKKIATEKAAADAEAKEKADAEARTEHEAAVLRAQDAWKEKRTAAVEKYGDYAEVAEAETLTVTDAMAAAMMLVDNGPDIAYHLGQNPEEASRIAAIGNPFAQGIEIARIAERLANPPRRRAPRVEPIEPIDTGTNGADTSEQEPDMDAYYAQRMAKQTARKPFFPQGGIH